MKKTISASLPKPGTIGIVCLLFCLLAMGFLNESAIRDMGLSNQKNLIFGFIEFFILSTGIIWLRDKEKESQYTWVILEVVFVTNMLFLLFIDLSIATYIVQGILIGLYFLYDHFVLAPVRR